MPPACAMAIAMRASVTVSIADATMGMFSEISRVIFGLIFPVLLLVPSAHALIVVHVRREDRRHREVVEAIRQHGPPPGYPRRG